MATNIPSNYSYKEVYSLHSDKIPAFLLPWLEEVVEKATDLDKYDYTPEEVDILERGLSSTKKDVEELMDEIKSLTGYMDNSREEIADLEIALSDAQDTIANLEQRESNV
jgi:predicted  nucleic acid-binding Zn-ribbon protein